jgi:hypothetical protein
MVLVAIACTVHAQPPQNPNEATKEPPPGVEKAYWELNKSENVSTRTLLERYVGLVKVQEWSDLSGKFRAVAHYVKHEPNLSTVTIAVMKGTGSDRTSDEKTVPIDKLSKTCQARVKQIDLLQKKLKELVAKGPNGTTGAPMTEDHGADPNAKGAEPGHGTPPGAAGPDPSASEPDPLGFAEVQLSPPPGTLGPPPGGASPAAP